jgi:hypothetical protein
MKKPKWFGPGGANYRAGGSDGGGNYGPYTRRTELSSYDGDLFARRVVDSRAGPTNPSIDTKKNQVWGCIHK